MSKERDLLIRVCKFLDSHAENDYGLISEIRSLLAQPNEEKLTMRQRLEEYKKGYARAEQQLKREPLSKEEYMSLFIDTYHSETPITDFVRLIEKAHGIGENKRWSYE
jgi:hypothetical protein